MSDVIHYHGGPIWGHKGEIAKSVWHNSGAFVSYIRPDQLKLALEVSPSVVLDNGAFSAWRRGVDIDWLKFWTFVDEYADRLDWWIVPDVVDGDEFDNDALIAQTPAGLRKRAAPVWHLHESIDRLKRLCDQFDRVCLGSSGEYARPKSSAWHQRIFDALNAISDGAGRLPCQLHGLRMLDKDILSEYPLSSADSTNLARNVPLDGSFPNGPSCKFARAKILKNRIEQAIPPKFWNSGLRSIQPWQVKTQKVKTNDKRFDLRPIDHPDQLSLFGDPAG